MKPVACFLLSALFIFFTSTLDAQEVKASGNIAGKEVVSPKESIFNIKTEYFKSHFLISAQEAAIFWPLFEQYLSDEKIIHKTNKDALKEAGIERIEGKIEVEKLNDAQVLLYYESIFKTREKLLVLETQFYDKLKKVLEPQSIIQFYNLERVFRNDVSKASKGECDIPNPMQKK